VARVDDSVVGPGGAVVVAQAQDAAAAEGQHPGGVGEDDPPAGLPLDAVASLCCRRAIQAGDSDGVGLGEDLGELLVVVNLAPGDAPVAGDGVGDLARGVLVAGPHVYGAVGALDQDGLVQAGPLVGEVPGVDDGAQHLASVIG